MERCGNDRRHGKGKLCASPAAARRRRSNMFATMPNAEPQSSSKRGSSPATLLRTLAPLAVRLRCQHQVVVVGYHNDITLYRELHAQPVFPKYIVQTIAMSDVMAAIVGDLYRPSAEPLGQSIAFIGAARADVGASGRLLTIALSCISNWFSDRGPYWQISDLPYMARPTSIVDQGIRHRYRARRSMHPNASTRFILDRLLTKMLDTSVVLAAPSMLDRGL